MGNIPGLQGSPGQAGGGCDTLRRYPMLRRRAIWFEGGQRDLHWTIDCVGPGLHHCRAESHPEHEAAGSPSDNWPPERAPKNQPQEQLHSGLRNLVFHRKAGALLPNALSPCTWASRGRDPQAMRQLRCRSLPESSATPRTQPSCLKTPLPGASVSNAPCAAWPSGWCT